MGKEHNSFIVHIEKVEDNIPTGWYMNPYIEEYIPFRGLSDMVLKIDDSLHELMEKEERGESSEMTCYHSLRDFTCQRKPQFFYLIQILYTCHYSWQGVLTGTNQPRIAFKSVQDCIYKINQAMQGKQLRRKQTRN